MRQDARCPTRAVETSSSDSLNLAQATAYDADGQCDRRRSPSASALPVRDRRAAAAEVPAATGEDDDRRGRIK